MNRRLTKAFIGALSFLRKHFQQQLYVTQVMLRRKKPV